ncbi:MAG TPA: ABC transporter permease [Vicinamibacterales bacterium]|jgi:putative ABC transport system permease protein
MPLLALLMMLAQAGTPDMLVSRQLLEREHLAIGQLVELSPDAAGADAKRFRIAGVYDPVPDPMRFAQPRREARVHLPDLHDTAVTTINVRLATPGDAAAFAASVAQRLPGLTARPTSAPDDRAATFAVLDRFHLAIAIVTVFGSGAFLLALMVMLVDERRETMATLRLIGFTRGRLLTQVLVEGASIAVIGVAFGVAIALAAQPAFNRFFQWRYDTSLIFLQVTPAIVVRSAIIALPVGVLASLAAGWTILRRRTLARIRR